MKNKKITVCLKNFNNSRLVFLQAPEQGPDPTPGGGLLNSLAQAAIRGQDKRGEANTGGNARTAAPNKNPLDHRELQNDPGADAAIEADVMRGLNTFGSAEEAPMPNGNSPKLSSRMGRVSSSVRNGIQSILRKVPIVGNSIARPIHTVKSIVHGTLHPGQTLGKIWRGIRSGRKKKK